MAGARFRITESTIAMSHDDGRGVAHMVSVGAVVEVHKGPIDGDRLVEVDWNGKKMMMFTQDLRLRAVPLDD
jgi:hypothetical protein